MAFFTSHRYKRLNEDQIQSPNVKNTSRTITALLALAAFIMAVTASAFAYNRCFACSSSSSNSSTTPTSQRLEAPYRPWQCQLLAEDAGCVYDMMMNSWLPKDCYDERLSSDFRGLRDWSFYADVEGSNRLSLEELSQRTQAHATLEYHFAHCICSLRKVQRAVAQGGRIEEDMASQNHDHHCSGILQRGLTRELEPDFSLGDIRTTLRASHTRDVLLQQT